MSKPTGQDVQEALALKVIAALTSATGDWTKPWRWSPGHAPHNVQSRSRYTGGNLLLALYDMAIRETTDGRYSTRKGWATLGHEVPSDAPSLFLVKMDRRYVRNCGCGRKWDYNPCPRHPDQSASRMLYNAFEVFHASEVPGVPALPEPEITVGNDDQRPFFDAIGATWREIPGNRAYYSVGLDEIVTPPAEHFITPEGWFGTVAHEHIHWTGASTRLKRHSKKGRFGTPEYAFEELVAELGAVFLASERGLITEPRPDHVEYIANWVQLLSDHPEAIMSAAAAASKAVALIMSTVAEKSPELVGAE